MKHEKLINDVMNLLLDDKPILKEQFKSANITLEDDPVGFFANFTFEKFDNIKTDTDNSTFGNVYGLDKSGEDIVGFVLFLKNGIIDSLEGYTYGNDFWPDDDSKIILTKRN